MGGASCIGDMLHRQTLKITVTFKTGRSIQVPGWFAASSIARHQAHPFKPSSGVQSHSCRRELTLRYRPRYIDPYPILKRPSPRPLCSHRGTLRERSSDLHRTFALAFGVFLILTGSDARASPGISSRIGGRRMRAHFSVLGRTAACFKHQRIGKRSVTERCRLWPI
jgi:hypothetical protein